MYYINCHAHTRNSDGSDSMRDMAEKAFELGHCALVVTDHDDIRNSAYVSNLREYKLLLKYDPPKIPIIIGSEITTPIGEYLLFGGPTIKRWHDHREFLKDLGRKHDLNLFTQAFIHLVLKKRTVVWSRNLLVTSSYKVSPYALIKCHPDQESDDIRLIPKEWWELVHGFEIQNGLQDYSILKGNVVEAYREMIPNAAELRNSDAHSAESLSQIWNEVPRPIQDEHQLIQWLQKINKKARPSER